MRSHAARASRCDTSSVHAAIGCSKQPIGKKQPTHGRTRDVRRRRGTPLPVQTEIVTRTPLTSSLGSATLDTHRPGLQVSQLAGLKVLEGIHLWREKIREGERGGSRLHNFAFPCAKKGGKETTQRVVRAIGRSIDNSSRQCSRKRSNNQTRLTTQTDHRSCGANILTHAKGAVR